MQPSLENQDLTFTWEPGFRKQVDEVKAVYIQARAEHRRIEDLDGNELIRWDSALGGIKIKSHALTEGQLAMQVFDETGDRRLIWDMRDPSQITECAELFEKYLVKGWKAYAVDSKGNKGRRVYAFDAAKEEFYFDDTKTLSEKVSAFSKAFGGGLRMLPRTYPG